MIATPHTSILLGVVIERCQSPHPWGDDDWRVIGVMADPPAMESGRWRLLREADTGTLYHAGNLPMELFRGETAGYNVNLSLQTPCVWVVLRPGEESHEHAVEPFLVTACPHEAGAYAESGDEQVMPIAMPAAIVETLRAFVAEHHKEEPFKKRRRTDKRALQTAPYDGTHRPLRGDAPHQDPHEE